MFAYDSRKEKKEAEKAYQNCKKLGSQYFPTQIFFLTSSPFPM